MSSKIKVDQIENTDGVGDVTFTGTGGINLSSVKLSTIKSSGGTTALGVNSNGVVTRNVIPAWNLNLPDNFGGSTEASANTNVPINDWGMNNHGKTSQQVNKTCFLQGGCTLNSGVVTVPVTGLYNISTHLRFSGIDNGGFMTAQISINNETDITTLSIFGGGEIIDTKPSADDYWDYGAARASLIANLTANDNVRIMVYVETDTSWTISVNESMFKGYLIG